MSIETQAPVETKSRIGALEEKRSLQRPGSTRDLGEAGTDAGRAMAALLQDLRSLLDELEARKAESVEREPVRITARGREELRRREVEEAMRLLTGAPDERAGAVEELRGAIRRMRAALS